jgi:hypothetical protein
MPSKRRVSHNQWVNKSNNPEVHWGSNEDRPNDNDFYAVLHTHCISRLFETPRL